MNTNSKNPLGRLSKAWSIAKCLGWENIPPRIKYLVKKRSGLLVMQTNPSRYSLNKYQSSIGSMSDASKVGWQEKRSAFFPMLNAERLQGLVPQESWNLDVTEVCQKATQGSYQFFSRWQGELGWPPDFNRDPVNNVEWSTAAHWTKAKCSGGRQDIKLVWEASRLSLAYYFARQYCYSEDETWAESLWEMLDAWIAQNPTNQTVAWECSQEVAFRLMAVLWSAIATLDSAAATEERLAKVHFLVWKFGKRIAATTEYGISQENNHALSEAAGLWTIGLMFPEFRESKKWKATGKSILATESARQIYEDGSYVQHSFNYHRVMLDDLLWAIRLGEINGENLPAIVYERFSSATRWLGQFVDESNGRVPNYGANDGANVLPLSCTDYLDFRPTLRAAQVVAGIDVDQCTNMCTDQCLDEKALWLTGKTPRVDTETGPSPSLQSWSANIGGYHLLRSENSKLMVRCGDFRDRPGQADMLHVDLWFRGTNVVRDSGSFMYYHEDDQLKRYFGSSDAHNVALVDGCDQMTKGPGFLWLDWPETTFQEDHTPNSYSMECRASFSNNGRGYSHLRRISQTSDVFEVTDSITPNQPFRIRWHLCPDANWREIRPGTWLGDINSITYAVCVKGYNQVELKTGWESLYYGEKFQHPVIEISGKTNPIVTTFGPRMAIESKI